MFSQNLWISKFFPYLGAQLKHYPLFEIFSDFFWRVSFLWIPKALDLYLYLHLLFKYRYSLYIFICPLYSYVCKEKYPSADLIVFMFECWRIDTFELCYWRRFFRVPWTARRSNQSILKEINPEYSWEGLMLKLKLWYFGHLMRKVYSLEKTLMLGKIEGNRRRRQQSVRWLDSITNSMDMNLKQTLGDSGGQRSLACCSPWSHKGSDMTQWMNNNNACFTYHLLGIDAQKLRTYLHISPIIFFKKIPPNPLTFFSTCTSYSGCLSHQQCNC